MRVLQSDPKRPLDLLAISADGHIAAAGKLGVGIADVDVWDAGTGRVLTCYTGEPDDPPWSVPNTLAFHPAERLLVGTSPQIRVIDIPRNTLTCHLLTSVHNREFALSQDGSHLLLLGMEPGRVPRSWASCYSVGKEWSSDRIWQIEPNLPGYSHAPAFSVDGDRVAFSLHVFVWDRPQQSIEIRETDTGKDIAEVQLQPDEPPQQLAFSADGSKLLVRTHSRVVKLFDATTGQPAGELVHPGRPYVTGMAVHPNGTVACSRTNGTVCLWDLSQRKDRQLIRTLDWKLGKLVSVAFSPDGSIGAAGTEDGQVVVWDVDA